MNMKLLKNNKQNAPCAFFVFLNSKTKLFTIKYIMNYDDFPILDDSKYKLINEQYQNTNSFDKQTMLVRICASLNSCYLFCLNSHNKYNTKIVKTIKESQDVLIKLFNNFTTYFNIKIQPCKTVTDFEVFGFMKKIIETTKLIQQLIQHEHKQYYISMFQKSIEELSNCLLITLTAISESNVLFFKYM